MYEVVVGNIGTVYQGGDYNRATIDWNNYVWKSRNGIGRAANEPVTMFENGEPTKEYIPAEQKETV